MGFRVSGLGFGVQGLGFRGSGLRLRGLGLRVQGSGSKGFGFIQGPRFRVSGFQTSASGKRRQSQVLNPTRGLQSLSHNHPQADWQSLGSEKGFRASGS